MPKRLLILGAGANQAGILDTAIRLGIDAIALDANPQAPSRTHAAQFIQADIRDPDRIAQLATEHRVDGIYPAAELSVEAAAEACSRLSLPGISPETATRVRNKLRMREALAEKTSFNPLYRAVTTVDEALEATKRLSCPIIVKPVDGNASKGVRLVEREDDAIDAFEHARHFSESKTVLLEECIKGEEFCVDGLVYNGRYILGGITGKEVSAPPNRFDECIFMPPILDRAVCEEIEACTRVALDAIGFRNGTTHVEIIMSEEGPRIVEIAGRPGGGRIPTDLIPLAYGTDYMADSIRIALGEAPKESRKKEGAAALFWIPAKPGDVQVIEGIEEARAVPGIREVVIYASVGDTLAPIVDCVTRDRVGYVLAEGDTTEEALTTARSAANCCKIRTAPADSHT